MFTILVVFGFFLFRCFLFRYFILVMAFKYYGCKCFVKHKRSFQKKLCFLITRSLAGSLHCNIIHHLLFSIVLVNINVCSPFYQRFLDIEQSNIKFVPTTFVKLPYCLIILLKQKRFKRIPNSNELFVPKKSQTISEISSYFFAPFILADVLLFSMHGKQLSLFFSLDSGKPILTLSILYLVPRLILFAGWLYWLFHRCGQTSKRILGYWAWSWIQLGGYPGYHFLFLSCSVMFEIDTQACIIF